MKTGRGEKWSIDFETGTTEVNIMWERVYDILDNITSSEKLIGAFWYEDDGTFWYKNGHVQCILCIQIAPDKLDYEEVVVSL